MNGEAPARPDRRSLLRAGAVGCVPMFQALLANAASGREVHDALGFQGYGPLAPVDDERTGLPLIRLPAGFRYVTFGWRLDPLTEGGGATPSSHDGMGVVSLDDMGIATLIRNHERRNVGTSFGPPEMTYDPSGRGGTTTMRFDIRNGVWLSSEVSLAGTTTNCAGGVTPWGSWLTCEEAVTGPNAGFGRTHGWVFEVPGKGQVQPIALEEMGRFAHEAVAVDPLTNYVYLTEDDRYTSGFYRFRPYERNPANLAAGGVLEMLRVEDFDNADLMLVTPGSTFKVQWVPVGNPRMVPQNGVGPYGSFDGQTTSASGPFFQGYEGGGAQFRRLEGCWYDPITARIYFVDTEGGMPRQGCVWCYDPQTEDLETVFVSPGSGLLDNPDNVTVSPRGGILLCEDGGQNRERLQILSRGGQLSLFAQNDVVLSGEVNGITGNFRGSEWCGATFDPTGKWLFVNIQSPGITFAITGPWRQGPL